VRQAGELADVQRTGTGAVRFRSVEVSGPHGASNVYAGGPVEFRLRFAADRPVSGRQLRISVGINSILGDRLITLLTSWDPQSTISGGTIADGTAVRCAVPELPLRPGKYLLTLYVDQAGEHLDVVDGQIELEVLPSDYFGAGSLPSETQGPFLVRHRWRLETEAGEAGTDRLVGDRA
jgi:hypothetical protein